MKKAGRWISVVILICLPVFDAMAQVVQSNIQGFAEWRIVNRFRFFNPWFGVPRNEMHTLMNAGVNTDRLLERVRKNPDPTPEKPELRPDGELVFYACLYGLSHGARHGDCRGLHHGNYHELFNWNPLTNRYQAPPGLPYPKGYRDGLVDGDWIIAVGLNAAVRKPSECKVAVHYGDEDWKEVSLRECSGNQVRFALPVTQVVANSGQKLRLLQQGMRGGRCPPSVVDGGRSCAKDEQVWVRIVSEETILAEDKINPSDDLLVVIGDSFGSGEGNPDLAGILDQRSSEPRFVADPVWLDRRCNRSMHAAPARAAMQMATEDDQSIHRSTTFISFACSGAKLTDGLLNRYDGVVSAAEVAEYHIGQAHFGTSMLSFDPRRKYFEQLQERYLSAKEKSKLLEAETPAPFPSDFYHRLPSQLNAMRDAVCAHEQDMKPEPMFWNCRQYVRSDVNLIVSIGGNDIGFAPLIADFVFSSSRDIATMDRWKAIRDGKEEQIRGDYVKAENHRKTVALTTKLKSDIGYLGTLFKELQEKIRNQKIGYQGRGGSLSSTEESEGGSRLGLNDIYLVGYPSPNFDQNGVYCHKQDFLGLPPFDLIWNIGKLESEFAHERVVKPLSKKLQDVAGTHDYIYIDIGGGEVPVEKFRRHGWCAVGGADGDETRETLTGDGNVSCGSDSMIHDASWKAYCGRQRWFRTLADAIYSQGPLPLQAGISSGAMHPTFEAHKYIGERIHEELRNSPPSFDPVASAALLERTKANCKDFNNPADACRASEWIMFKEFEIAVSDPHGLKTELEKSSCRVQRLKDGADGPGLQERVVQNCKLDFSDGKGTPPPNPSRAKVKFTIGQPPLDLDGRYSIELMATDQKDKKATRAYSVNVDGNKPVILMPENTPREGAPEMWLQGATIQLEATDDPRVAKTLKVEEGDCAGSGVKAVELELEDVKAARLDCVLIPVRSPDSCKFAASLDTASLELPEPSRDKRCRRFGGDTERPLGAVTSARARAVDVAGWIGDWQALPRLSIDLRKPEIKCKYAGATCPDKEFTAKLGEGIEICATDEGGSGIEPASAFVSGIADETIELAAPDFCSTMQPSRVGSFDLVAEAKDKSKREVRSAWRVTIAEAIPDGSAEMKKSSGTAVVAIPTVDEK